MREGCTSASDSSGSMAISVQTERQRSPIGVRAEQVLKYSDPSTKVRPSPWHSRHRARVELKPRDGWYGPTSLEKAASSFWTEITAPSYPGATRGWGPGEMSPQGTVRRNCRRRARVPPVQRKMACRKFSD